MPFVMGVGNGGRGVRPLWILKISAKKGCFLSFEWEKQISPLLAPCWKNLGKIPWCPPGKNPSDAHALRRVMSNEQTHDEHLTKKLQADGVLLLFMLMWCH